MSAPLTILCSSYEFNFKTGPLDVFIPINRHLEFERVIRMSRQLSDIVVRKLAALFNGEAI